MLMAARKKQSGFVNFVSKEKKATTKYDPFCIYSPPPPPPSPTILVIWPRKHQ